MNYGDIKKTDVANGPGVRVTLFVSGCRHHCKDCFQPETWNFTYGNEFTKQTEDQIIEALSPSFIEGLTLLGGEPFEPENQRRLVTFLERVRKECPQKNIWGFSGYTLEELAGWNDSDSPARCEVTDQMLDLLDVLVDGEFVAEQKNISLKFRGSENQRLIKVAESLAAHEIIPWE